MKTSCKLTGLLLVALLFKPALADSNPEDLSLYRIDTKKWNDRAFRKYFSPMDLARALNKADSSQLTNVTLQLLHTESVLYRSHQAVSAKSLFAKAVNLATVKHDQPSLNRLAEAAKQSGDEQMKSMVDTAMKLGSSSRSIDSVISVSLNDTSEDEFAQLKRLIHEIDTINLVGTNEDIEQLKARIRNVEFVPGSTIAKLLAEINDPTDRNDNSADLSALAKLSAVSRAVEQLPGGHMLAVYQGGKAELMTRDGQRLQIHARRNQEGYFLYFIAPDQSVTQYNDKMAVLQREGPSARKVDPDVLEALLERFHDLAPEYGNVPGVDTARQATRRPQGNWQQPQMTHAGQPHALPLGQITAPTQPHPLQGNQDLAPHVAMGMSRDEYILFRQFVQMNPNVWKGASTEELVSHFRKRKDQAWNNYINQR